MAKQKIPANQLGTDNESWAQQHLESFRDHLVPSSTFYAETKATLFQKIAADKRPTRAWYILPNALQKWAGVVTAASVLAGVLFAGPLFAPKISLAYVGEFGNIQGTVFIHRAEGTVRAQSKDKIFEGDTIEVASASKAEITLAGDAQAELAENTKIHVGDVMTMHMDNAVASQVHLQLQQGTYAQKKTESGNQDSATMITLATPSGTIKSTAYADFVVNADKADQVALSVQSSGVTVMREGNNPLLAAGQVVQGGQSVVLNGSNTDLVVFATTDLKTATGSLIATMETSTKESETTKPVTVRTTVAPEKAPVIAAPVTSSLDVSFRTTLDGIQSRLEIAQIKMQQAIDFHNRGDDEQARIAMAGYVNTAKDVYTALGATTPATAIPTLKESLDTIIQQSPLNAAYNDLSAKTDVDKTSEGYQKTLESLQELSRAEAAMRVDIASKGTNTNTAVATPSAAETDEPVNVNAYTKKVQTGVYGQVEAIVANPDNKARINAFVELLARIPNESRNVGMLERIQSMVPQSLRGFVEVKIHRINYPEAANK